MKSLFFLLILFSTICVTAQNVYKTPSGKKYHLATCHMVKNVSEEITLEEAAKLGLEPCQICNPTPIAALKAGNESTQGTGTSAQCKGHTKAGTRCKHMTRIGNGYCFQHQSK
jgi:hypothetical protein